jgi:hypothetical protein
MFLEDDDIEKHMFLRYFISCPDDEFIDKFPELFEEEV